MNGDHDTDGRPMARPDTDRPQPGTVYQCPNCDLSTLSLQTLRNHWIQSHATEYGQFCHADITVRKGP
jgi:hypothetical protein